MIGVDPEFLKELKRRKLKYLIFTYGCQMNVRDTETIAGLLEEMGFTPTEDEGEADLILFNTCSVRANPERKVYGKVLSLRRLKEEKPHLLIGICGCMVQQEEELARIREELPHVDLVFGTHNLYALPQLLQRVLTTGSRVLEVLPEAGEVVEDLPARREGRLKAFVNIMYGCNNFCSYCIVPYTRGRERSRRPEAILREVEALAREGYKEVTLLGQNVNSYGRGLTEEIDFPALLERVSAVAGIARLRFTTSHPKDMSDRLIQVMAENPKVCEHLHLPLQAGSDRILARMNRGYTAAAYRRLVERIREAIPEISLTTDLIVGFPGETEEDFQATLALCREIRFDSAFMFAFSPRVGTPAATMEAQVPQAEKEERLARLIETQNAISKERNAALTGCEVEVMWEGVSPHNQGMALGRTRTNKVVLHPLPEGMTPERAAEALPGRISRVRVREARTWTLYGEGDFQDLI